jgi:hypothetical protein
MKTKIGKRIFLIGCVSFCLAFAACQTREKQLELALLSQLKTYPESRLQDIYKNFYQDCFGTGHAISDTAMVARYLEDELANMPVSPAPPIEPLGWRHNFVRVNIDLVRQGKMSVGKLAEAFTVSAAMVKEEDMNQWTDEWHTIVSIIEKRKLPVKDFEQDKAHIDSLLHENPRIAMHHSRAFNEHYRPHYRVVAVSVFEQIFGSVNNYNIE